MLDHRRGDEQGRECVGVWPVVTMLVCAVACMSTTDSALRLIPPYLGAAFSAVNRTVVRPSS